MKSRSRALLCLASLVFATLLLPGTALANPCEGTADIHDRGGEAAADCSGTGDVTTRPVGARGSSGPAATCTDERASDPAAWFISFVPPEHVPETYRDRQQYNWLDAPEGYSLGVYVDCTGELRSDLLWLPTPEPGSAEDTDGIFAARAEARARVEPAVPVVGVSPEKAVVRFPTWLWLDESYWQPASASATTPGGVTVTVEATPVEATWDLDDGVQVCDGPGVPWSELADAAYELQPEFDRGTGNPACTFTFVNSSSTRESGVFEASVTVRWEFSWTLNGVDRGVFGSVVVSDSWALRVGEVQAVITG